MKIVCVLLFGLLMTPYSYGFSCEQARSHFEYSGLIADRNIENFGDKRFEHVVNFRNKYGDIDVLAEGLLTDFNVDLINSIKLDYNAYFLSHIVMYEKESKLIEMLLNNGFNPFSKSRYFNAPVIEAILNYDNRTLNIIISKTDGLDNKTIYFLEGYIENCH
ncbi:hypothetical protein [Vibrio owensii]|uniref:hypothetical protein n=1 Tax=Vibrio owensii TaxID=696485 RepID=UPI00215C83EA|nr:hypothetical protein [Vibrio owensii]MCR9944075.1 hypothetical protein [Vibrio owensii]